MATASRRPHKRASRAVTVAIRNEQHALRINTALLKRITQRVLAQVGWKQKTLGVVLVDDATIAKLNATYHHTAGATDVLSFDYGDGVGELVISTERAAAQAKRFGSTPARELALYVIHGILHLHGYDDLKPGPRRRMRAAERRQLSLVSASFDLGRLVRSRSASC